MEYGIATSADPEAIIGYAARFYGWLAAGHEPPTEPPESDVPFEAGQALAKPKAPVCAKCKTVMEFKDGVSKKDGSPWQAWWCPKGTKDDPHPKIWL
jgi:hypothetical protein